MAEHGQRIELRAEIFGAETINALACFGEGLAFSTNTGNGNLPIQNACSARCDGEGDSFGDVEHIPGPGRKYDGVAQRLVSFPGKLIRGWQEFLFPRSSGPPFSRSSAVLSPRRFRFQRWAPAPRATLGLGANRCDYTNPSGGRNSWGAS